MINARYRIKEQDGKIFMQAKLLPLWWKTIDTFEPNEKFLALEIARTMNKK